MVIDAPNKDLYLDDFVWVSGQWEFQYDDLGHFAFLRYRGYVPNGKSIFNLDFFYLSFLSEFCPYFVFGGLKFLLFHISSIVVGFSA